MNNRANRPVLPNPMGKGEVRSKKHAIIPFKQNHPEMTAKLIATKVKSSENYVWNVLSKYS